MFFVAWKNLWRRLAIRAGVIQGECGDGVLKVVVSHRRNDRFWRIVRLAGTKRVFFQASQIKRPAGSGPGQAQRGSGWCWEVLLRASSGAGKAKWKGVHSKVLGLARSPFFHSRNCNAFRRRGVVFFLARKNVWCHWVTRAWVIQCRWQGGVLKVVV
jgi:hypothetical protein